MKIQRKVERSEGLSVSMPFNAINIVLFVSPFVSLVVKYLNHKVHKGFRKGHEDKVRLLAF